MGKQLQLLQVQDALNRHKDCYGILGSLCELKELCKKEYDSKLLEIVPIKIVACFEDYFRIKYSEIIDNAKCRGRLKDVKIFKNLQFDFDVLGAFQDNAITLGEYLSYLIPCSKIDDITDTLNILLEIDFFKKLKEQTENAPKLLNSINETFRLRHIFCHEIPKTEELNSEKVSVLLNDAHDFLSIAENIITDVLYPNVPLTTLDMRIEPEKMFVEAEKELESLIEKIKSKDKEQEGDLANAQFNYFENWKQYRDARAKSECSNVEGGSIYPVVYAQCLTTITKAFIKELNEEYKYLLRK